ncbi:sugar-binding transcriptional regulator [Microbacterium mitrae]
MATVSDSMYSDRQSDALRAAHLYYVQSLTMKAIAAELRVSRSSVSRLLAHARDSGLVRISLHDPDEAPAKIAVRITERFDTAVHIVPVSPSTSDIERLRRVAVVSARLLGSLVESHQKVGLAWGSTLNAVSRALVPQPTEGTVFVQLNGSGNIGGEGLAYSSDMLRRFADAFEARVEQFPVPAFFDDPLTRQAFWRERTTQRILRLQTRLDLAVFSVGSPFAEVPSHVYHGEYLDRADYQSLTDDKVVGDIATVFYRADGSTQDITLNARATGPDFRVLRRTPRRVCIVAGSAKVVSLLGALAAGMITDLIIDEASAAALLRASDAERRSS